MIILALVMMFYTSPLFSHPNKGVLTTAVITEIAYKGERYKYGPVRTVVVSYEVNGKAYERGLVEGRPWNPQEGKKIKIYYNSDNPEEIWGGSQSPNLFAKVLFGVGVIILVAGVVSATRSPGKAPKEN